MIFGITNLSAFVIGAILIVLLPGPNSLYVMAVASRSGVAAAYRGAFGIFLGDAVLMFASAMGIASLLRAVPAAFLLVKFAGAIYLAWMGLGMLRASREIWTTRAEEAPTHASPPRAADGHSFRTALVISLMNPKAILFFLSFFIQFVDVRYAHPALSYLIQAAIVQTCSAAYLTALIFGGSYLADQFRRRRRAAAVGTGMVGSLFLAFSVKLATATLK
jgi:leucine efflux protein